MIAIWLSDSVTQFRQGDSSLSASAPLPLPFPPPLDVPQACHPVDPPSATSQAQLIHCCLLSIAPPSGKSELPPPVVAGSLVQHRAPPFVVIWPVDPQFGHNSFLSSTSVDVCWEMFLDRYVNIVTAMINDGRSSYIGHGVLRLEGQTAWGVCLKINDWDSSQSRRVRLRVGVLYYVGNRTLTLHVSVPTVKQLLLPQDWTFATLASLPSVSQVGEPQPPLAPTLPATSPLPLSSPCAPPSLCQAHPVPPLSLPQHSSPCTLHWCQSCQELISLVRRLTFPREALQTEVYRMARLPLHLLQALPSLHPHSVLPPPSPPPLPPPMRAVLAIPSPSNSATTPPPALLSSWLRVSRAPDSVTLTVTVASVLTTVSLFLSGSLLLLHLVLLARPACVVHEVALLRFMPTVRWASVHPLHQLGCQRRSPPHVKPRCRRPDCLELAPPDCSVSFCNLHCTSPRCVVHDPPSLRPRGSPVNDATPTFLVH